MPGTSNLGVPNTTLIAGTSHVDNQQPRHIMCKVQRLSKGYNNNRVEYSYGNG